MPNVPDLPDLPDLPGVRGVDPENAICRARGPRSTSPDGARMPTSYHVGGIARSG
ncbi:hypothetical protein [Chondromyces apiculatus]|uniref:Uncharacterized protein n=1 Tax=Chondromyces apiculatus DSM 436 TaxID=1192034 RepID=A0A017SX42_9BACT|nr:hypothetical protein [Chondromyces apiculatus]EYF01513.1 Hypothetical protein CAP_8074 [Chondromyces apiculatus DSM 436]